MCFYFCTFRFLAPWPAGCCRTFWNPQGQLVLGWDMGASDFLFLSSSAGLPGAQAPRGVRGGLPMSVGRRYEGKVLVPGDGRVLTNGLETRFLHLSTVRSANLGNALTPRQALPGPAIQRRSPQTVPSGSLCSSPHTGRPVITGWLFKREDVLRDVPKPRPLENRPESECRRETQGSVLLTSLLKMVCVRERQTDAEIPRKTEGRGGGDRRRVP